MIVHDEWLPQAKRLAVGMQRRIWHMHERRPNLVIANDVDKWWCYCHACHEGSTVQKSHVLLGDACIVSDDVVVPNDIRPVYDAGVEVQIERFLASKNMSSMYLPELWYSESRQRLMLKLNGQWHGRDLTGRSLQKWMNYGKDTHIGNSFTYTAVTEDIFSMFKVRWAMREYPNFTAVCALGTSCRDTLTGTFITFPPKHLAWFFDADSAGDRGARTCITRMRPHVQQQSRPRPPDGLDPKDMTCSEIRELLVKEMRL